MKKIIITQAVGDRNEGHGHVFTRPDRARMRCGGPSMCKACAEDMARLNLAFVSAPLASLGGSTIADSDGDDGA